MVGDLLDQVEGDSNCVDCLIAAPCSLSHAEYYVQYTAGSSHVACAAAVQLWIVVLNGVSVKSLCRIISVFSVIWRACYSLTMPGGDHVQGGHSNIIVSDYLLSNVNALGFVSHVVSEVFIIVRPIIFHIWSF